MELCGVTMSEKINNLDIIKDLVDEKALCPDGFEDAVIGYVERCSQPTLVLLDSLKCIKILMERDNMTEEDAWEFFNFNVLGSWVGEYTPCFATLIDEGE